MARIELFLLVSSTIGVALSSSDIMFDSSHHDDLELRSPAVEANAAVDPQTIFLPWASSFTCASKNMPGLRASVAGKSFVFPVDVGSTGVLISSILVPSVKLNRDNPFGWGWNKAESLLYTGQYADLDITFASGQKGNDAVSRIHVLVVTKIQKCVGYNSEWDDGFCPRNKGQVQPLKTILWMGVGFGQTEGDAGLPYATPDHNPFLVRNGHVWATD